MGAVRGKGAVVGFCADIMYFEDIHEIVFHCFSMTSFGEVNLLVGTKISFKCPSEQQSKI